MDDGPKESKQERELRLKKHKIENHIREIELKKQTYSPFTDSKIVSDPYRTIFVGRLSFGVSEDRLAKEFDDFGRITNIRIVKDEKSGKSRGYAFIEFRDERAANDAIRRADGRRIDGRRIIVDREFGRTSKTWLPRRLGGGKGELRRDEKDE